MDLDTKIKEVLIAIQKDEFNESNTLPNESREELKRVILMCEDDKFISHRSSKQKLVQSFMGGGFMLNPTVYVTRAGEQFLEGLDRNERQSSTVFNIEKVEGSALGNYNTVNNYSEKPLEDLTEFVKKLEGDFKSQGEELINTLEKKAPKQGYLSKFDNLLNKYPKIVDLISSFLTSLAVTQIPK